jgi:hypothetical protein
MSLIIFRCWLCVLKCTVYVNNVQFFAQNHNNVVTTVVPSLMNTVFTFVKTTKQDREIVTYMEHGLRFYNANAQADTTCFNRACNILTSPGYPHGNLSKLANYMVQDNKKHSSQKAKTVTIRTRWFPSLTIQNYRYHCFRYHFYGSDYCPVHRSPQNLNYQQARE